MGTTSTRFGWYLAVLQLFFALCWTVYVIYLPKLAALAGIAPKAVIPILMLDQAIFTVCDFATGIAADKVTRVLGRLGVWVTAATALSCAAELQWLMPVFWIGFNISMFPAGVITNRLGGYAVMGGAALIGALAILAAQLAQGLEQMVIAQFAAGAAWGAILMSAFTVAFAIGENGGEGRMSGLLFSALALATLARMATVATGFNADPSLKAVLGWMPIVCWAVAGTALLYLATARVKHWMAR
jgi:MFS family permease